MISKIKIYIIPDGVISRRRAVHICKIHKILQTINVEHFFLINRITSDALFELKNCGVYKQTILLKGVESIQKISKRNIKSFLEDLFVLPLRLILCKLSTNFSYKIFMILGTLNPFLVICSKTRAKKSLIWAGGFVYTSIENSILRSFARVLESISILLSETLLVETPNVIRYIPIRRARKLYPQAHLFVDERSLDICSKKAFNERKFLVGYIGALEKSRNPLILLKVIHYVTMKYNRKAIVIGDGPYYEIFEKIASRNRYLEVHRTKPYEEVMKLLGDTALLLWISSSDGLPNTILEAMMCKTLVVSTDVGGLKDVVKDNITGILVIPTLHNIVNKVEKIIKDPRMATSIAKRAYSFVKNNYTLGPVSRKWRSILENISHE